ncbi:MAG: L-ribulose-5-phosphate 4-epimerase AraD [Candidatus Acidiferrales bacterium]
MSLDALREQVLNANLEIVRSGLVISTFGNASGIDRAAGRVVIKPSGVPYDRLLAADLVVTDLAGRIVEGKLRPSSDSPTHLALYRAFDGIGGVVHTHSRYATAWAQAGTGIPCFGTTHADYFHGAIPVTEPMPSGEIQSEYEWNTGQAIIRRFASLDPLSMPAVLVAGHGPFCWGASADDAAHNAIMLEELAHLAYLTVTIRADANAIADALRDKHFLRKHGPNAYYGQSS